MFEDDAHKVVPVRCAVSAMSGCPFIFSEFLLDLCSVFWVQERAGALLGCFLELFQMLVGVSSASED